METNLEDGFWFGDVKKTEDPIGQSQYGGGGYRFTVAFQIGGVLPTKIKNLFISNKKSPLKYQ